MHSATLRAVLAVCLVFGFSASVACNRDPAAKEARFLARGKKLMDAKEYGRAVLEFNNAAKLNPRRAETWYQMGLAYLGAKRFQEGVMALRRAVEIDPKHSAAQIQLSALMVQSSDPKTLDAAVKRLDQVLATQANEPDALDLLAVAELKLNQPEDAEKHLRQALDKFPGRLKSSATLAALQFSRKDFDGAEKTLQAAVAQAPQSVDASLALAQLYLLEKKMGPAEDETRRALRIDPASSPALMALGRLQVIQGKMEDADQTYQKVASLPKTNLSYIHAAFLLSRGKTDEGIAELDRLAKAAPGDRDAHLRLVNANLAAGRQPAALAVLDGILKKNAKDVDALMLRSRIRLQNGKTAEAEADLQEVLHFKPDSAEAHYGMARVYGASGRDRMREKELGEAVRLRADMFAARADLMRMQIVSRHADVALQTIDAAPAAQKTSAAFVLERNWALLAMNRVDEAAAALAGALKIQSNPKLILQRAMIRQIKKDYAGAQQDAAAVLHDEPHNATALNVLVQSEVAQKDNGKAVDALRAVVKNESDPPMQVLAGEWLATLGRPEEARGVFNTLAARPSGYIPADLAAATLDMTEKKTDAAKTRLLDVIRREPKNDAALLLLGQIEYSSKNYSAALPYFRTVADMRPQNTVALNATAYLLAASDPDQALKYAESALELAPDTPMIQDTMGWVYYKKGMYGKAIGYLEAAVAKDPTPVHQFHLAMSYLKGGDRNRGGQLLNTALAKDPNLAKTEQGW